MQAPNSTTVEKRQAFFIILFNLFSHTVNSLTPILLFSFFTFGFYFHGEVMLQLFIKCRLENNDWSK